MARTGLRLRTPDWTPWALSAIAATTAAACAEGTRLEVTNNYYETPDDVGDASPSDTGGAPKGSSTGGATATGGNGGAGGAAASAGRAGSPNPGADASAAGAGAGGTTGDGGAGASTSTDGGPPATCVDPGEKSCGGLCVAPTPSLGCSLSSCAPCPAVANATPYCTGALCDFDCDPGYLKDSSGCTVPADCTNGVIDGTETDIDCGGSGCPPCVPGGACLADADCDRGPCQASVCGCTAATCATIGLCGSGLDDGCVGTIDCSCGSGQTCYQATCCTPSACDDVNCGSFADNCGGTVSCGCSGSKVCDQGLCCAPSTCGGSDCGILSNGCGGTKDCGACPGCDDGVQNLGETAIDCGGSCLECPWGRWALNEASGTTAADWSGNARDGTLTNFPATPWVAGQLGGALTFDGSNDYVSVGTAAPPAGAITITAWVNTDSVGNEGRIVASKRDNAQSNRAEFQFAKNASGVGPTDEMAFSFNVASTWYIWHTTNLSLSTNTWTHVAVSYAAGAAPVFYKNGAAVSATQWTGTGAASGSPARPTNTAETRIGGAVNAAESPWDGELDDVRIYARVLAASEIVQVMNGR